MPNENSRIVIKSGDIFDIARALSKPFSALALASYSLKFVSFHVYLRNQHRY